MNVLVYGAGAVGLGLASCLLKSGNTVDLLARPDTVAALRKDGLRREGIFGEAAFPPAAFGAFTAAGDLPARAYDAVLVTVKSFDTDNAARDLAGRPGPVGKATRIVLCQNGWGNAEIFAGQFPKDRAYNMRVITGFERPAPNRVRITVHADAARLGSLFGRPPGDLAPLAAALTAGGLPAETTDKVDQYLWTKLIYNCALNPLGAILDVPYGRLGEDAHTRGLMDAIITETYAVMAAAGHAALFPSADDFLRAFYGQMLPATYDHRSSTLQDLRAGRRTEIDALNGVVGRLGREHRVAVPVNQTVYAIVKFISQAA